MEQLTFLIYSFAFFIITSTSIILLKKKNNLKLPFSISLFAIKKAKHTAYTLQLP